MRGLDLLKFRRRQLWRKLFRSLKQMLSALTPWQSSLRAIEANFGTGLLFIILYWLKSKANDLNYFLLKRSRVVFYAHSMAVATQHSHCRIRRRLYDHSLGTWKGIMPEFYTKWYGRVRRAHSWRMLHEFFGLRRPVRLKERQLLEWLSELCLDHRIQSFFGSLPNYSSINAFD